jgi:hypothetical protein
VGGGGGARVLHRSLGHGRLGWLASYGNGGRRSGVVPLSGGPGEDKGMGHADVDNVRVAVRVVCLWCAVDCAPVCAP